MITWCDQTLEKLRDDINREHSMMRFCDERLKMFDKVPDTVEELLEWWEMSTVWPQILCPGKDLHNTYVWCRYVIMGNG